MIPHWPFVGITVCFMLGILSYEWGAGLCWISMGITLVILGLSYYFRHARNWFAVLIWILFGCLGHVVGFAHSLFAADEISLITSVRPRVAVMIKGVVVTEPRTTVLFNHHRVHFDFAVHAVNPSVMWQTCSGRVRVQVYQKLNVQYGDELILEGKLTRPFEFFRTAKFSYRDYLRRQGIARIFHVSKDAKIQIRTHGRGQPVIAACIQFRQWARQMLTEFLNPTEVSLMEAMLLGIQTHIPKNIADAFRQTGTTHILAISGLNVGMVVVVLFIVFRMLPGPRNMAYVLTMIFIGLFVAVTGASASVIRAGIMASVVLAGTLLERESDGVNALGFAGFVILLLNPQEIYDIGFQLSFMSVLTILLFSPLFQRELQGLKDHLAWPWLTAGLESMVLTVAATLGVAGLIVYYFNILTPISILANIVVVPLSSLVVVLGMGLLFFVQGWPFVGACFAVSVKGVLSLMVATAFWFKQWPGACIYMTDISLWQTVGYYFIVAGTWLFLKVRAMRRRDVLSTEIDKAQQL